RGRQHMNRFAPGEHTPSGGRDRPPRRSRAGEPAAPTRRRLRTSTGRTSPSSRRGSTSPTPATVWTVDPAPADLTSRWPLTVVDGGRHPGDQPELRVADLVIASVGPDTPLDDRLGLACARLLRTGGILVVLTHSDWTRGRLVDPTGPIVATAQNADLLYLQHI